MPMHVLRKLRHDSDDENASLVHHCALPQMEDVLAFHISAGWCIMLRRKLKSLTMVSVTNPRTRLFLKSNVAIRQERVRHVQYYYYTIHPFSVFREYWETFVMACFIVSTIMIPLHVTESYLASFCDTLRLALNVVFVLDCFVNFWTGYYNVDTKIIILDPKLIVRHYLRGRFLVDFIAAVPFYLLPYLNKFPIKLFMYCVPFIRVNSFMDYLGRFKEWKKLSNFRHKVIKTFVNFFFIVILTNCVVFLINKSTFPHWSSAPVWLSLQRLFYACFRGLCVIFMVEFGDQDIHTHNPLMLCGMALGIQIGFILQSYMLASVLQIMCRFHTSRTKYEELISRVNTYVIFKNFSARLRNRLFTYFEYKFQSQFYSENEIVETISPQLKQEIAITSCLEFIERVDYFRDLPPAVLFKLVKCLQTIVYLTDDIIVHAGYRGDAMFFINYGTVAVFTMDGSEVCHLSDGAHFGEIALLSEEKRVATVVALQPCELFRLSRQEFQTVMADYPEYLVAVRRLATMRLQQTLRVASTSKMRVVPRKYEQRRRRTTMLPKDD